MIFPPHACGLYLTHNEHRTYYESVAEWISYRDLDFVSDEQRAKAIATDELWVLHWYPRTPVCFVQIAAADLDVLLEAANREPAARRSQDSPAPGE